MRPRTLWLGAVALYGLFWLWYDGFRGPLLPEEVETYMARFEARPEAEPERLAVVRNFLESDDGGEFFMLNLIRFHEGEVAVPGSDDLEPARAVLEPYTRHFVPGLLRRAGHPAFVGDAAGRYVEHWGVEPDPGWSFSGVIRYRSRRDMIELATHPGFDDAHAFKIAALSHTLAFPVAPGLVLLGPRVWVALVLALLAALGQLALAGRSRAA